MRNAVSKATILILLALGLGIQVERANAEADGTTTFFSQKPGAYWSVRLVCTTISTEAADTILYQVLTIGCGSYDFDWGAAFPWPLVSQYQQISADSTWKAGYSTYDSFTGNGTHSLSGTGGTSSDFSDDACYLYPIWGC